MTELYKSRRIMRYIGCIFMSVAHMIFFKCPVCKCEVLRVVLVGRLQYREKFRLKGTSGDQVTSAS